MRIIVCGGRDFDDPTYLMHHLDAFRRLHPVEEIIHGDARGADSLAGWYARQRGIVETKVPADWKTHGKAAGPIRNQKMLDMKPDMVVAFKGGSGTAHMVRIAEEAGIPVYKF